MKDNNPKKSVSLDLISQFKMSWKAVLFISATSSLLVLVGSWLTNWLELPIRVIYRDPVTVLDGNFAYGFLSQAGVMMWIAAAAVFLFSGINKFKHLEMSKKAEFLFASGILSLWMGLDDVYLLHEQVLPTLSGLSENQIYMIYAVPLLAFFIRYLGEMLKTEVILLGLAAGCILISVGLDVVEVAVIQRLPIAEDIFKLIGIVSWVVYSWRTCQRSLRTELSHAD